MTSSTETRTIIRVLKEFQKADPDITLPSILAFLLVNERDGQSQNQAYVEEKLEMSNATTSRAISYWAKYKKPRTPSLNMLESLPDPEDRRYNLITLNRTGLALIEKIRSAFNGDEKGK